MNSSRSSFGEWVNACLSFVYPEICQVCKDDRATKAEGYVCQRCWTRLKFIRPPFCERCGLPYDGSITGAFECANCKDQELHFSSARSAVVANDFVRDIIHKFKYSRSLWFEPFLTDLLVREAVPALSAEGCDMLIPVPLHSAKQREREFNQAAILARGLAARLKVPVNEKALKRVQPTQSQTLLDRKSRSINVKGAFALNSDAGLKDKKVILIDDVFTTGATTSACAKVLLSAGAGDVSVWTVARGL